MAVGFKVKYYWYQIGTGDFLHSFFSTICYHLEKKRWGEKFPYLMNELYQGKLDKNHIAKGIAELQKIKQELHNFPPSDIIWDIENLNKNPPWGGHISSEITDLSHYFIIGEGENLILLLERALQEAKKLHEDLYIDSLQPENTIYVDARSH